MELDLMTTTATSQADRRLAPLSRGSLSTATCCLGVTLVMACASGQGTNDTATGSVQSATMRTQDPNTLTETDLIIISADQQPADLERAWRFVPRMLHDRSLILREQPAGAGKTVFQVLPVVEVHRLARESAKSVRRAA